MRVTATSSPSKKLKKPGLPALSPRLLVLPPSRSLESPVPAVMMMSSGSSSRVPKVPLAADRSTVPRKSRYAAETSAKPPSPPLAPPRALRLP